LIDPLNRLLGTSHSGYVAVYGLALAAFVLGSLIALALPSTPPASVDPESRP
jgi:hypothetical protein